jgi:hypothetical protein
MNIRANDGRTKRRETLLALGMTQDEYDKEIITLYVDERWCAQQIRDRVVEMSGIEITVRSMQRQLERLGVTRAVGDAFRLAAKTGRVKWAYKENKYKRKAVNPTVRYRVMERDKFKCVLCGATAKDDLLELDHIVAVSDGGGNEESNLRVLCYHCNVGRHKAKKWK